MPSNSGALINRNTHLDSELEKLRSLGFAELQQEWQRRMGTVPKHLSAELLRRRLAYEIQASSYGALKPQVDRRLVQLDAAFRGDPNYSPSVSHVLTPGTVLVRAWRGKAYKVQVLENGFSHGGRIYESLSEIAGSITGTKWSGPAFFGLRKNRR